MKTSALPCVVATGVLFFQIVSADLARAEQYPRDEAGSLYEERFDQEEREMMQPGWGQEREGPSWTQDGNPQDYEQGAWREEERYREEGAPSDDAYPQYDEPSRYEDAYPQEDAGRYEDASRYDDSQPYADAPHYREDSWQPDQEQPYDDQERPYGYGEGNDMRREQ